MLLETVRPEDVEKIMFEGTNTVGTGGMQSKVQLSYCVRIEVKTERIEIEEFCDIYTSSKMNCWNVCQSVSLSVCQSVSQSVSPTFQQV